VRAIGLLATLREGGRDRQGRREEPGGGDREGDSTWQSGWGLWIQRGRETERLLGRRGETDKERGTWWRGSGRGLDLTVGMGTWDFEYREGKNLDFEYREGER